ncbi:MAG: sulfotransferase [Brumimicrobium sp.]
MEDKNRLSLFIVGLPRSGTKLLRELLNNHSKIFIPKIEAYFIPHLVEKYGSQLLTDKQVHEVIKEIQNSLFFFYYVQNHQFNLQKFYTSNISIQELLANIWQEMAINETDEKKEVLGDKTPRNVHKVRSLLDGFPGAKIIHIIRDPRDNVLSSYNKWSKNIYRTAHKWQNGINDFNESLKYTGDQKIHEVKYEDLLTDTNSELKKICQFLGIDYEEGMNELVLEVENKGGKVDSSNFNKFEDKLSEKKIKKLEEYCMDGLQQYSYRILFSDQPKSITPGQLQLLRWKLYDAVNLMIYNVNEHGLARGFEKIKKARKHS